MSNLAEEDRTEGPRIARIELTPAHVPFKESVREVMRAGEGGLGMAIAADEEWLGGDFVICKLIADDGSVGLGEVFVWLPETGVSPAQIIDAIEGALGSYALGESPFDVLQIGERMERNVARNEVAKGLIDMACYDLMGKIDGRPCCDVMGGSVVERVPLAALVPLMDVASMVGMAEGFAGSGYKTVRIKLGRGAGEDADIVERIRDAVGGDVRLRVDYNQAYDPAEAVRAIKTIEPFRIDFAEQPVAASDYPGMAYVQERVDTPLMAHEGCFSLRDIVTLIELGAIGVVGLNTERPGGVTNMLRALVYAEQRGMAAVLHNQTLGVAAAVHLHIACARHDSLGHATELFGHVMYEDDLIVDRIDYGDGAATVPTGPGWGVELDEDALARYAMAPATVVDTT